MASTWQAHLLELKGVAVVETIKRQTLLLKNTVDSPTTLRRNDSVDA
jgi:hypothetical protein